MNSHIDTAKLTSLDRKEWLYIASGVVLTFIGTFLFIWLLQQHDASSVILWAQPASMILAVCFGYFFFEEGINSPKVWGCAIIALGLFVLSKAKT